MKRRCEICGAAAGLWTIELRRGEGQEKPDLTLTLCGSCLPGALDKLDDRPAGKKKKTL